MARPIEIPDSHRRYSELIHAIQGNVEAIKFGNGVSMKLYDGRIVDLVPLDDRLAVAITNRIGDRIVQGGTIEDDDISGFWFRVY